MKIFFNSLNFQGRPENYAIVDSYLSRSAQPQKEDIAWLKEQGVTDVFNFRTMHAPDINYDEKAEVEKLGLKYHSIPSITNRPSIENINRFLDEMKEVKARCGKAHVHCKAGADRTGMYSFIYKALNGIGTLPGNQAEWFERGYHYKRYPDLMKWTIDFIYKIKKH